MVLAGSDVWWCDAAEELRAFVERIEAPVFLNAMARGSIHSGHPNLGSLGRRYGLVKADAVILIGTPIDFRLSYGDARLFPQNPKLIEIMMDPNKIGLNRDVDAGIVGDTKGVLSQILEVLGGSGFQSKGKAWVQEVMSEKIGPSRARMKRSSAATPVLFIRCASAKSSGTSLTKMPR